MDTVLGDKNLLGYVFSFLKQSDFIAPSMVSRFWRKHIQKRKRSDNWKIHSAFKNAIVKGQDSLVSFLIWNRAMKKSGWPIKWAAKTNNSRLVHELFASGYPITSNAFLPPSTQGNIEMLDLLQELGRCRDPILPLIKAAKSGQLSVIQWFEENYEHTNSSSTCKTLVPRAIKAHQNKLFDYLFDGAAMDRRSVLTMCLCAKNMELAERFWRNQDRKTIDLSECAAKNNLVALRWLCDVKGVTPKPSDVLDHLGRHEVLEYLLVEKGVALPHLVFEEALDCTDDVQVFELLLDSGCPFGEEEFHAAVQQSNVAALTVLKARNCPFSVSTVLSNADGTTFALHRWLRENGFHFPLTEEHLCMALQLRADEHVRYLLENNCPYDINNLDEYKKERLQTFL
ncbi:hypothetical protein D1R32_gp005 [Tunisvirus fontaine2]|uniref:Ankyrin repeat-containing protein n=2 Tax=root TaxID=1 RepID=V9SG44_9VIRU|nr:hypothetical protein D1R32_gp005 [Tunisvirus fontaine2]AHC54722.1 hypothetical protein TNS_ORF4 [Tunisvirus fontaine2]